MNADPKAPLRPKRARAAFLGIVLLVLAASCGDDAADEPPPPPGPVAMNLGELLPRGSDTWKPGDAEPIVMGCDRRLGVTVVVWDPAAKRRSERLGPLEPVAPPAIDELDYTNGNWAGDWLFRPPGACGRSQCGTLFVSVESVASGERATAVAALETAVVDLAPLGSAFEGRLRVRAELRENGTETVGVYLGEPLADELELDAIPDDCAPDGEGGASGAPGSGGTAGSGGTGTGGTGNQGGEAGGPATGGSAGTGAGGAPGGAPGEGGEGGA